MAQVCACREKRLRVRPTTRVSLPTAILLLGAQHRLSRMGHRVPMAMRATGKRLAMAQACACREKRLRVRLTTPVSLSIATHSLDAPQRLNRKGHCVRKPMHAAAWEPAMALVCVVGKMRWSLMTVTCASSPRAIQFLVLCISL